MLASTPTDPNGEQAQANTVKRRRRSASGAEHARRQAWGRKQGRLNAAAYREALRKAGDK